MTTPGFLSRGSTLWVGDGASPEVFMKIARVRKAVHSSAKTAMVDMTNADTTGTSHESIPGSNEEGDWTVDVNFIPDNATQDILTGVQYAYRNRLTRNYRVVYPTTPASGKTFAAFITDVKDPEVDSADTPLVLTFTLHVTGQTIPFITAP